MNQKENQTCADCPEKQPRWASLIKPPPDLAPPGSKQIGAFVCLECSGSHRRLGVHIAFVRSVNLDQWKEQEVLAMENGGNSKVNLIYEARLANLGTKIQSGADGRTRERYIRDKYERRKYYDPSVAQNEEEEESSSSEEEEEEEETPPVRSASRSKSEVARRRAQARGQQTARLKPVPRAAPPKRTPAPRPAAVVEPEVDLLDFGSFPSEPVKNATPLAPPSQPTSPQNVTKSADIADLFGGMNMSARKDTAATAVPQKKPELDEWTASFVQAPADAVSGNTATSAAPRKSNADIMAMFQTAQPMQQQQQNGMMMMMQPSPQQPMMQGYGNGMNMQQQQRMMMNYGNVNSSTPNMQQRQRPQQPPQQMAAANNNNINMMYAAQQQQQQMAMMNNQFQMNGGGNQVNGGGMMQMSPGFDPQQQEQMMAMMQGNSQPQQQQQEQFSAFNQFHMNGMG